MSIYSKNVNINYKRPFEKSFKLPVLSGIIMLGNNAWVQTLFHMGFFCPTQSKRKK